MLNVDLKWLVVLAIVVLVGTFAFGATSLSAALDPLRAADANLKNAQTQAQVQHDNVDIKYYEAGKQTQLEAQKQQLANQTAFEQQRQAKELALLDEKIETERQARAQQLAHAEQSARIQNALLDWGGRVLTIVVALVLLIATISFAVKQIPQLHPGKVTRGPVSDVDLGRLNNQIQHQFTEMRRDVANLEKRGMSPQWQPTQPRGNGSNGNGHEPPTTGKLKRLVLVK